MGAARAEVIWSTAAAVVARPISARISSRELVPELRASLSHCGSSVLGTGRCSSIIACSSSRSPKATDSSYLTVRR
ncbi:Uncharacterised protein [Bordetella pertussis]|nr:Uncharacterised protein [Bordetella pertussis]